jgi:hypothetical protein
MSAAEEPRPVLATSARATPVGLNGGIAAREAKVTGRLRLLSYKKVDGRFSSASGCGVGEGKGYVPGLVASRSRYLRRL